MIWQKKILVFLLQNFVEKMANSYKNTISELAVVFRCEIDRLEQVFEPQIFSNFLAQGEGDKIKSKEGSKRDRTFCSFLVKKLETL